jgi:hypothetical protein
MGAPDLYAKAASAFSKPEFFTFAFLFGENIRSA